MFDLLPIKVAAFRGLDLKVQLVAVPGQPMYAAIRRLALRDVDALVFVADSAVDRQEDNITSLKEMTANLAGRPEDAGSLPLVLQYNKRDLVDVVPTPVMDRALNPRNTAAIPAVAIRGEGVLETLSSILTLTVTDLARRYRLADLGGGQKVEEWSAAAVREIFGTRSLVSGPAGVTTARQTVRLTLPADVSGAERLDARTNEALVESYAQAAAALGEGAQQVREERDLVQRRLANVLEVLDAARTLTPGAPRDPLLAVVLGCLAREVDAPQASLLVPVPNHGLRTSTLQGLEQDPILRHPEAMPRLRGYLQAPSPRWHETDSDPALREMLWSSQPPPGSVVSVPLTAGQDAPLALALLYRPLSAPPPRRESLKHLTVLARILAPFLEPPYSAGGDGDASAREALGTAFRLAAPRLLQGLRELRQRLTDLRRRPDGPAWLLTALAEIAPGVAEAASIARSLAGLDTGALEDEPVPLDALLGKLRGPGVRVEIAADVTAARVDPTLFGLALDVLVERARLRAGPDRAIEVRAAARGSRLVLRIGVPGPAAPAHGPDQGLLFPAKVLERHGGHLSVEVDPVDGSWVVLDVAAG